MRGLFLHNFNTDLLWAFVVAFVVTFVVAFVVAFMQFFAMVLSCGSLLQFFAFRIYYACSSLIIRSSTATLSLFLPVLMSMSAS